MTIELLSVNLDGCFAPGQAYVACSRGRSADTMVVEGFREQHVITSEIVKKFYSSLKSGGDGFTPPTWAHALEDAKNETRIKEKMEHQHRGRICKNFQCTSVCIIYKVKKDGPNKGKWVSQCKEAYDSLREKGLKLPGRHSWDPLPAPGLQ